jgi:D-arginine dehydrogenase
VPAHDVQPEEMDIATGIFAIERDTSLRIRRPRRTWAGLRSFSPDGELIIGFDAQVPNFFWLAAQGGYGIQSAVGASALAAALITRQRVPDALLAQGVDPAALSPRRFNG